MIEFIKKHLEDRSKSFKKNRWIDLPLTTQSLLGSDACMIFNNLTSAADTLHSALEIGAWYLCHTGLQDQGVELYKKILDIHYSDSTSIPPENVCLPYLQFMMFGNPDIQTNEKLFQEHTKWATRLYKSKSIYLHYPNTLSKTRRIKVGYTCNFVTNSVSTVLLMPLLKAHNSDRVEVFMYSDEPSQDHNNPLYKGIENWRDTHNLNTDSFCELLRKDEIDILIELNGLIAGNRYHVIARHPVPIQVAWYNYPCTTGIPGMDYTLTGEEIDIKHLQKFYSEIIYQKQGCLHAMPFPDFYPPISPPPFEKNGFITFGSFGQAHKVNIDQIRTWCEVLKRVPDSKFFMKAGMLDQPTRAAWVNHFTSNGIDKSRLILEGNSDYSELLKSYSRVDIALDTFPYNAGTTSVEALIQGVPVISQIADRYSSQIARINQGSAGHPELIAFSREGFILKAVALANDTSRLANYRNTLRSDFLNSKRCNVKQYMYELEDAYQNLWFKYLYEKENVDEN